MVEGIPRAARNDRGRVWIEVKRRNFFADLLKQKEPLARFFLLEKTIGNDLLSQGAAPQVPSVLANLTTGFEMGPGVPSPLQSPRD